MKLDANARSTMIAVREVTPALRQQPGACPTRLERAEMPKSTCSVDGCEKLHSARGWCHMHYMRWWNRAS